MTETLTETELAERLKRIRIAREVGVLPWSHLSNPTQQFQLAGDIIDFLLSLIDSKAAEGDRYHEGFDEAARISRAVSKLSAEDAASAMRDKCVEKVRELARDYQSLSLSEWYTKYGDERWENVVIPALESLTLDQEKLQ